MRRGRTATAAVATLVLLTVASSSTTAGIAPRDLGPRDGGGSAPLEGRKGAVAYRPTDGRADPLGHGYRLGETDVRHICWAEPTLRGEPRTLCLHWATSTRDAPPSADADGDGVPDQIERTRAVLHRVWAVEILELGYRPPRRDDGPRLGQGPNRGLDVYLVDVGRRGLYGYCTSDEPDAESKPRVYAYCVLDDDFSGEQFDPPNAHGLPALRIAAAHEFFHAVQFAYESPGAPRWLTEGTATWMEDQVYDGINDHYQYLDDSAIHQPEIPLDEFERAGDGQDFEYGAWVFWQFLSEYLGTPDVVRDVWRLTAPGSNGDRSALEALRAAVALRDPVSFLVDPSSSTPFRVALAEFGVWNYGFAALYEEGSGYLEALHGSGPPEDAVHHLGFRRETGWHQLEIDHLSRRYVLAVTGSDHADEMEIVLDLPRRRFGSEATLVLCFADASGRCSGDSQEEVVAVRLDEAGNVTIRRRGVAQVVIVLTNAHARRDDQVYRYRMGLSA